MAVGQVLRDCRLRSVLHFAILFFAIVIGGFATFAEFSQKPPHPSPQDAPQPIYSDNPGDPWNRIFYCLFTRRVEARVSSDYPEGAPFTEYHQGLEMRVSTRTFERLEIGDRAIDPLYPNFLAVTGAQGVLTDPKYSEFAKALQDALHENTPRAAVARALMQSDLWSAYDQLHGEYTRADQSELEQHRRVLADLLGHLIRRVALTPEEIRSLPANYSAAMHRQPLPDIFNKASGWVEILWFPHRMHELAAGDRRVARVFLKFTHASDSPRADPHASDLKDDLRKIMEGLRRENGNPGGGLDGVALVMQLLLIDTNGKLTPTSLTTDVQVRLFEKTAAGAGAVKASKVEMAEVSRRLFVSDPASGGLAGQAEDSPAYLPSAGNDYTFASPQSQVEGAPIQVHLRTRCALCHGPDLTEVMTFDIALPPQFRVPPVRPLDSAASQEADDVIARKKKRAEFKALQAYFDKPSTWWPFGIFSFIFPET